MNDVIKFKGVRNAVAMYNHCKYVRIYVDVKEFRVWASEFASQNSWNKYSNPNIHEFDFNVVQTFDKGLVYEIYEYFEQNPRRKYNCNIFNELLTSYVNNYKKMY